MKNSFKEHFKISKKHPVDFLNVPLDGDLKAFLCPLLIANCRHVKVFDDVFLRLKAFLEILNRSFIITNNRNQGLIFLSHLHEPNEYHLGYSGTNNGKAIAEPRAEMIFNALSNNKFVKQGIGVTNEAHGVLLLVEGIGQDIMSDIISNVCRDIFAEFTHQQCLKYSIPTNVTKMHYYNGLSGQWEQTDFNLPSYCGKPVILIPNRIVSGGRGYSKNYSDFVTGNIIAAEILNGKRQINNENKFVKKLKDGTKRAIIEEIQKEYGKAKSELIDFVILYNDSLERFLEYAKNHYPALNLTKIKE